MAEQGDFRIDEEAVRTMAGAGTLNLGADRPPLLAPQLDALLQAANDLNTLMADKRELVPVVQFVHPDVWKEQQ